MTLDAKFEGLGKARVSVLAADNNDGNGDSSADGFYWGKRGEVFHSEFNPLFHRPPQFSISYRELGALFRIARHLARPDQFDVREEDEDIVDETFQQHDLKLQRQLREAEERSAQAVLGAEERIARERHRRLEAEERFARLLAALAPQNQLDSEMI